MTIKFCLHFIVITLKDSIDSYLAYKFQTTLRTRRLVEYQHIKRFYCSTSSINAKENSSYLFMVIYPIALNRGMIFALLKQNLVLLTFNRILFTACFV